MIPKTKLMEEERINSIIESILGKIIQIITAYNLRDKDTEEARKIKELEIKLEQFIKIYANEYALIKKDEEISKDKIKSIENIILQQLGSIIKDLESYKTDIDKMLEKAAHNQSISHEYEEIHKIHGDYIKQSQKVDSELKDLERAI